MNPITPDDFIRAAEAVANWTRPLLMSHQRPDGDAIGSLVALERLLTQLGARPTILCFEPPPARYRWLLQHSATLMHDDRRQVELDRFDSVVVVDTGTYAQLRPIETWMQTTTLPKLVIDHHVTRNVPTELALVDEHASAAALIVFEWAAAAGWNLDERARLALYVGLATDTGWFRFSSTDVRTLSAATALVEAGVRPADVFECVYQQESAGRLRLLSAALGTVQLFDQDRLAVMTVTQEMLRLAGADPSDTEDLINYPLMVGTIEASVLLAEQDDGPVRASFRSKPPTDQRRDLDVAGVAAEFGGGGHRRAAGARIAGTINEVRDAIVKRLT